MRLATAIAATIDAPSCMAPQVTNSVAHYVASEQRTEPPTAAIAVSPSPLALTSTVVPHWSPSAHPVSVPAGSHPSPFAAPPFVVSSPSFLSPVSAAVHVRTLVVASAVPAVYVSAVHAMQTSLVVLVSGAAPAT